MLTFAALAVVVTVLSVDAWARYNAPAPEQKNSPEAASYQKVEDSLCRECGGTGYWTQDEICPSCTGSGSTRA